MAWSWLNTNNQGEDITPNWANEVRNAIARIIADLYTSPTNDNTPAAKLPSPVQGLLPLKVGVVTCNGSSPVTATVAVSTALIDDYVVIPCWQDAFDANQGEVRVVKSISNGTLTMSFTNTGTTTGNKAGYVVYKAA